MPTDNPECYMYCLRYDWNGLAQGIAQIRDQNCNCKLLASLQQVQIRDTLDLTTQNQDQINGFHLQKWGKEAQVAGTCWLQAAAHITKNALLGAHQFGSAEQAGRPVQHSKEIYSQGQKTETHS